MIVGIVFVIGVGDVITLRVSGTAKRLDDSQRSQHDEDTYRRDADDGRAIDARFAIRVRFGHDIPRR